MPTTQLPDYFRPLAAARGLRAYYGDIHNHCDLSYGHGTLPTALARAKRQLDFVSVTGHAYWPDMPVDDPSVAHIVDFHVKGFARLKELWPDHFDVLTTAHEPGLFTVFPGYEIHSFEVGDYTIILRDLDKAAMVFADSPAELEQGLREAFGDRAMAFPHHIGYRPGARGINWDMYRESLSPVVELVSMHGAAETSMTDRPFLHSMGPSDGRNTIHAGWSAGHKFGALGNTDHHSGYPGSYGHGRSAVYAPKNTPGAIWNALHARHTVALTGDNCHLFALLGDAIPGDTVPAQPSAELQVEAVGGSFIDYIDVVKNGHMIERITPELCPSPLSPLNGSDNFFDSLLVLELGWGARGQFHDWQGEIRLSGGEIHALEPRLRGPEIVSPLEGKDTDQRKDVASLEKERIRFDIRAHANPNNTTAATQSLSARVNLMPDTRIQGNLGGMELDMPASRLLRGAFSGNLGGIDTPAFRLHPLPRPEEWQWQGRVPIGELAPGDWVSLRMRQRNGQWAWSSAFFCE